DAHPCRYNNSLQSHGETGHHTCVLPPSTCRPVQSVLVEVDTQYLQSFETRVQAGKTGGPLFFTFPFQLSFSAAFPLHDLVWLWGATDTTTPGPRGIVISSRREIFVQTRTVGQLITGLI